MKIRVKNFQSLKDQTLKVEGFTVVTGRSNIGKSAVVRAVRAMLYGSPGEHYIRSSEDFAGGFVDFEDPKQPLKIIWRKVRAAKKKPNLQSALQINDKKYTKLGKDHRLLTAKHGLTEMELSTKRITPHIAKQSDPPFLLTESETFVAEVFKVLGRIDVVTRAQKLAKSDSISLNSEKEIRHKDLQAASLLVKELHQVPSLEKDFKDLSDSTTSSIRSMEKIEEALELISQIDAIKVPSVPKPPSSDSSQYFAKLEELMSASNLVSSIPPKVEDPDLSLEPIPDLTPALSALSEVEELLSLDSKIRLEEANLHSKNEEQESLLERKKELEGELGFCPTCDREFSQHD